MEIPKLRRRNSRFAPCCISETWWLLHFRRKPKLNVNSHQEMTWNIFIGIKTWISVNDKWKTKNLDPISYFLTEMKNSLGGKKRNLNWIFNDRINSCEWKGSHNGRRQMLAERCPQSRWRMVKRADERAASTSPSSPSSPSSTRVGAFTGGDETSVRNPVIQPSRHCQDDHPLRWHSSSALSGEATRQQNGKWIIQMTHLLITSWTETGPD